MSYSNATFYLDPESGSDTARSDLVPTAYANNGSGLVRVTCNSTAAYANNAVFDVAGTTGSVYVGPWKVTIIDGTHVDLQGSTFTSNPASKGSLTPRGGSSKTDAWKTITSGATSARVAAGDTIRIKGSLAPTLVGTSTWTSASTVRPGTASITSSTNATPIVVTLSGAQYAVLNPANGDTVIVNAHTTNTKANGVWKVSAVDAVNFKVTLLNADGTNSVGNGAGGATGTIRKITNCVVTLPAAVTKAIAVVGNQGVKGNWTASSNVTCTVTTSDFKEGGECQQIAIGATFTTGLAAFVATGTLDLSTYQQVTFWVKQTAGTVAVAGDAKMQLCTNVDGTGAVHDVAIPALSALNIWTPVTVDLAGNLNAGVKSINWNQLVDRGAQTFLVDCITACKASSSADSLSLISLIGKNVSGETWWPIQSINDVRVVLEGLQSTIPASSPQMGYYGTSEAVATYKRETTAITAGETVQQSGSSGSVLAYSGGWDRTSMATQNLETVLDGRGAAITGITLTSRSFVSIEKVFGARMSAFLSSTSCIDCSFGVSSGIHTCGMSSSGVSSSLSTRTTWGDLWSVASNSGFTVAGYADQYASTYSYGNNAGGSFTTQGSVSVPDYSTRARVTGTVYCKNNSSSGLSFSGVNCRINAIEVDGVSSGPGMVFASSGSIDMGCVGNVIGSLISNNSSLFGIRFPRLAAQNVILSGSTTGNASGGISLEDSSLSQSGGCSNVLRNFTINEATKVTIPTAARDGRVYIEKYGATVDDTRIFTADGTIKAQTTVRHTASGVAWQFSPTSTNISVNAPLDLPLAQIAVAANALVTVKCWIQRDSTSITARLNCRGGQLAGVASDVTVAASGSANTWQEETITFTPTEAGVVEIHAEAYGGTNLNAFYDDFSVTQA